jgi:TnsA endonuclease N terminal.
VLGATEHESALERDFVTLVTFRDPGARILSQPVTISFREGSASRRYTPDFLVHWTHAGSELFEIKYRADLRVQWPRLRPAFLAARAWACERGVAFRIATDRGIRGPLLENAKRLLPLRSAPIDRDVSDFLLGVHGMLPQPTFGSLVAAVPMDRSAVLGTLWRMIARGEFRVDLDVPITFRTQVIRS